MGGNRPGLVLHSIKDGYGVMILKIKKHHCPADNREQLRRGDHLVSVNGIDVRGKLTSEMMREWKSALREAGAHSVSEELSSWTATFSHDAFSAPPRIIVSAERQQTPLQEVDLSAQPSSKSNLRESFFPQPSSGMRMSRNSSGRRSGGGRRTGAGRRVIGSTKIQPSSPGALVL